MQKKIDALETSKANLDAWKGDITALQTSLDTLKAEQSLKIQELEKQVKQLEKDATTNKAELEGKITNLKTDVQQLETTLLSAINTLTSTVNNLNDKLGELEQNVNASLPDLSSVPTLTKGLLKASVANISLHKQFTKLRSTLNSDLEKLRNRIITLEKK